MSEPIKDGGPAWPRSASEPYRGRVEEAQSGMSLRDYFAGQALVGMCAHPDKGLMVLSEMAEVCYRQADAMLKERDKQ